MHVTIDARMARVSGIGTYITELLPRVVGLWTEARFTVLGGVEALQQLVPSDRVTFRSFAAPIYSLAEQLALPGLIARDTALFWAPHYNIPLAYTGRLAVTVHDVNHLALPQQSLAKLLYARTMFAAVKRRASVVFCDSRFTASALRRHVGEPRALAITLLGVSARWFTLPASISPVGAPYFLYVGNVKPHKNLPRLLMAFARVMRDTELRLVIVGRQEGLRTADDAVARIAETLGDRVIFTGHLDRALLERYVTACQALVLPSLYEGFGLPALEALACGRAVAVSNTTSLPEVCGPMAEYFDPLDVDSIAACLARLASRSAESADLPDRRRAWARQFDWDECAHATLRGLRDAARTR